MAAVDTFNPDVQPVPIPESTDVTHPISRPEADKSKGTLFEGIGKGLTGAGQVITDATKLQDFTNKEWLSNHLTTEAEAQRDYRTAQLEGVNNTLTNIQGGQPPPGVASAVQSKADKLKALADQSQQDVYFRGRVAQLAKEYRAAYPQYRDFIDKTLEKAGFGDPANRYMTTLEQANQRIQAQLSSGNDKLINEIYTHLDKTGARGSQMIQALQGGADPNAIREEFSRILNNGYRVEQRQKQFTLAKAQGENVEETSARTVTQNAITDTATYLHDPQVKKDIDYLEQASKQGGGDGQELINISNRMKIGLVNLKAKARDRDSVPQDEMSLDEYGNEVSTGRKISHTGVLKEKYAKAADEGFSHLTDIINRLDNGDYALAKNTSNMVKAAESEQTQRLFNDIDLGRASLTAATLRTVAPEWLNSMIQSGFLSGKLSSGKSFNEAMDGFISGTNINSMGSNPKPVYDVMKDVVDHGITSPSVNKAIVDFGPKILSRPDTPKEAAANTVQAYFGFRSDDLMGQMKSSDRAKYYQEVTKPSVISNVGKLDAQHIGVYSEWVRSQFSKGVADSLNMLPSISDKYKVSWDDKTHQFDVHYPEDRSFQRDPHYVKGQNVEAVKERINGYLKGLSNYAQMSGLDVNAFVINEMKSAGLRDNKFWDALKAQSASYVEKKKEEK